MTTLKDIDAKLNAEQAECLSDAAYFSHANASLALALAKLNRAARTEALILRSVGGEREWTQFGGHHAARSVDAAYRYVAVLRALVAQEPMRGGDG